MGDFDATCSITRTAIHAGDEILLVTLPKIKRLWPRGNKKAGDMESQRGIAHTYEFMQSLMSARNSIKFSKEQLEEDDFSDLSKERAERMKDHLKWKGEYEQERLKEEIYYKFGTYNGYGWIEEEKINRETFEFETTFFIHKKAVDEISKVAWKGEDDHLLGEYEFLIHLVRFAWIARIQLFGNYLLGQQYGRYEDDEKLAVELVNKLQREAIELYGFEE